MFRTPAPLPAGAALRILMHEDAAGAANPVELKLLGGIQQAPPASTCRTVNPAVCSY